MNLDDINPTLEDFMPSTSASSSTPLPSGQPSSNQMPMHFANPQMPSSSDSYSNPPSNQGLKRKASDEVPQASPISSSYNPGSAKQIRLEHYDGPMPGQQSKIEDANPMRRLEMMANSQNFMAGNNINEVVEASKK